MLPLPCAAWPCGVGMSSYWSLQLLSLEGHRQEGFLIDVSANATFQLSLLSPMSSEPTFYQSLSGHQGYQPDLWPTPELTGLPQPGPQQSFSLQPGPEAGQGGTPGPETHLPVSVEQPQALEGRVWEDTLWTHPVPGKTCRPAWTPWERANRGGRCGEQWVQMLLEPGETQVVECRCCREPAQCFWYSATMGGACCLLSDLLSPWAA